MKVTIEQVRDLAQEIGDLLELSKLPCPKKVVVGHNKVYYMAFTGTEDKFGPGLSKFCTGKTKRDIFVGATLYAAGVRAGRWGKL